MCVPLPTVHGVTFSITWLVRLTIDFGCVQQLIISYNASMTPHGLYFSHTSTCCYTNAIQKSFIAFIVVIPLSSPSHDFNHLSSTNNNVISYHSNQRSMLLKRLLLHWLCNQCMKKWNIFSWNIIFT